MVGLRDCWFVSMSSSGISKESEGFWFAGKEHFVKEVKTVAAALKFGAVWNQPHRDNTIASSQLSYRPSPAKMLISKAVVVSL